MRSNISSIRTKKMMAEALISLMKTKPIDKITVRDITSKCGVNRQTFYYHFHDIFQLAEWMFKEQTNALIGDEVTLDDWPEAVLKVANFTSDNKDILIGIINSVGNQMVTNFVYEYIRPHIKKFISMIAENYDVDDYYIEFLSNFYTVTLSGLILEWSIKMKDSQMSAQELVRLIKITTEGHVESSILRYIESNRS